MARRPSTAGPPSAKATQRRLRQLEQHRQASLDAQPPRKVGLAGGDQYDPGWRQRVSESLAEARKDRAFTQYEAARRRPQSAAAAAPSRHARTFERPLSAQIPPSSEPQLRKKKAAPAVPVPAGYLSRPVKPGTYTLLRDITPQQGSALGSEPLEMPMLAGEAVRVTQSVLVPVSASSSSDNADMVVRVFAEGKRCNGWISPNESLAKGGRVFHTHLGRHEDRPESSRDVAAEAQSSLGARRRATHRQRRLEQRRLEQQAARQQDELLSQRLDAALPGGDEWRRLHAKRRPASALASRVSTQLHDRLGSGGGGPPAHATLVGNKITATPHHLDLLAAAREASARAREGALAFSPRVWAQKQRAAAITVEQKLEAKAATRRAEAIAVARAQAEEEAAARAAKEPGAALAHGLLSSVNARAQMRTRLATAAEEDAAEREARRQAAARRKVLVQVAARRKRVFTAVMQDDVRALQTLLLGPTADTAVRSSNTAGNTTGTSMAETALKLQRDARTPAGGNHSHDDSGGGHGGGGGNSPSNPNNSDSGSEDSDQDSGEDGKGETKGNVEGAGVHMGDGEESWRRYLEPHGIEELLNLRNAASETPLTLAHSREKPYVHSWLLYELLQHLSTALPRAFELGKRRRAAALLRLIESSQAYGLTPRHLREQGLTSALWELREIHTLLCQEAAARAAEKRKRRAASKRRKADEAAVKRQQRREEIAARRDSAAMMQAEAAAAAVVAQEVAAALAVADEEAKRQTAEREAAGWAAKRLARRLRKRETKGGWKFNLKASGKSGGFVSLADAMLQDDVGAQGSRFSEDEGICE